MKTKYKITSIVLIFALFNVQTALSETLNDALRETYATNLNLHIARHATEEAIQKVKLAESGFFPTIAAVASLNYQKIKTIPQYTQTRALQLVIDQNVFSGFKTIYSVKAAKARAQAQLQNLHNEEQNQLNNAVAAYVNVYATRSIVELRHSNLVALKEQVRTAKARLDVGEGTKTDYAQAQASYSRAISEYSESIAQNTQAEAVYRQIIGRAPENLTRPESAENSIATFEEALKIAFTQHPAILASTYNYAAAQDNVESAKSDFYPKLDISAGTGYQKTMYDGHIINNNSNGTTSSVGLKLTVPIYAGGARFSQLEVAQQELSEAQLQVALYRDSVKVALVSAWAKLKSSKASVLAYLESVKAAKVALMGREAEHKVGQATELDVLNTRSQLITMQVALVNAKRDLIVASYNLKAALGNLTASVFKLSPNNNILIYNEPKKQIVRTKTIQVHKVKTYPITHIRVK